jgi:hypothetical protein
MSTPSGNLYHPVNKHPVAIYEGFSWPCLFFGFFWFLYKNMWAWALEKHPEIQHVNMQLV